MSTGFDRLEKHDIEYIVSRLWERGKKEAELFNFKSEQQLVDQICDMATEYGYGLFEGIYPVVAFGAHAKGDTYKTWFIATEDFQKHAKKVTVFLNHFLKQEIAKRPDVKRLEMVSAVDHPQAERWFRVIGFEPCGKKGVFAQYVYKQKEFDLLRKKQDDK